MRAVASAVFKREAAVHNVRSGFESMTGVDPDGGVDATSVGAVLDPVEVIWPILLVKIADGVEELVVNTATGEAPVGKSKRLPARMNVGLAVGAAGADADVRPAAVSAGILAGDVDTDVVGEARIVDKLDAAHGQGKVVKLVVDLLPVLRRNSVLNGVRYNVPSSSSFAVVIFPESRVRDQTSTVMVGCRSRHVDVHLLS